MLAVAGRMLRLSVRMVRGRFRMIAAAGRMNAAARAVIAASHAVNALAPDSLSPGRRTVGARRQGGFLAGRVRFIGK